MTVVSPDKELVGDYVARGSEAAFRALVSRYLGLVYGTALRQVGDRGTAEEIAQNVFMSLARKAPRLRGMETLAGWLHRTTILESRARTRADLRRAQREETAAEIAKVEAEGASLLDPVEPLLDEALLHLKESDRTALMLRFWEERTLKDVGTALGLEEDAARKRIARALDQLAKFFNQHGFQVGGAACGTMLAGTAKAGLPPTLAANVANAGLSAGTAAGPFNLLLLKIVGLTKTQTAVACIVCAAIPLAMQQRAAGRLDSDLAAVQLHTREAASRAVEIEQQVAELRAGLDAARSETANAETRIAALAAQRAARPAPRVYRWDDNSPIARFPKSLIRGLSIGAMADQKGTLSPEIKEALQLTPDEADQAQAAVTKFLSAYMNARMQSMRCVEPTEKDLKGRNPEDVRVLELPEIPFKEMREALFADLEALLGPERKELFRQAAGHWMPIDDTGGMSSGWAVLSFSYRMRLRRPPEASGMIPWTIEAASSYSGSMSSAFPPDQVPELYRPHIQDWIALAQANEQARKRP